MNAPYAAAHFDVASSLPAITPVQSVKDLAMGMRVAGSVLSITYLCGDYDMAGDDPIWRVEALLDGGLRGGFGCRESDLAVIGGEKAEGRRFTATVSSGVAPASGDYDLEPKSAFYLSGLEAVAKPVRPSAKARSPSLQQAASIPS